MRIGEEKGKGNAATSSIQRACNPATKTSAGTPARHLAFARRFKRQPKDALRALERQGGLDEELLQRFRRDYLALSLEFYFVTPLQRDLDNGLKITQDALCEYLGANDNRVVDIHLTKRIDPLHPHLDVELEAIEDWQFDKEYVVLT